MNARILEADNLEIKRFFALDTRAYEAGRAAGEDQGAAGAGRVDGAALRRLRDLPHRPLPEEGVTRDEFFEAFNVALVVGGSITIPHLRRAVATLDGLEAATGDLG